MLACSQVWRACFGCFWTEKLAPIYRANTLSVLRTHTHSLTLDAIAERRASNAEAHTCWCEYLWYLMPSIYIQCAIVFFVLILLFVLFAFRFRLCPDHRILTLLYRRLQAHLFNCHGSKSFISICRGKYFTPIPLPSSFSRASAGTIRKTSRSSLLFFAESHKL